MAKSAIALKCFKSTLNGVSDKGELPSRLKLFDWGKNHTSEGDFTVDEGTVSCFARNQNQMQRQTVQVDFNHNSVEGTAAYEAAKGSPELAGYGVPVVIPGEGIFLEAVETTPSGMAKAADYKDLSPTPLVEEKTGRVIGLHSVALVPAGATEGLTIESAALKALNASIKTLSVPDSTFGGKKEKPSAYKNGEDEREDHMDELMTSIHKTLGLEDGTSIEDVCEKLKAKYMRKDGKTGPLDSPAPGTEIVEKVLASKQLADALGAAIRPLEAALTEQNTTIATLQASLNARAEADEQAERARVVAEASRQGKVIPLNADEIKATPLAILKSLCAGLPKDKVPTVARTVTLNAEGKPAKRTLADSAAAINAQLGLNQN